MTAPRRLHAPRLPGIGAHQSARRISDEWLTPPELVAALGVFDLDPCAAVDQPWRTARRQVTVAADGLARHWRGRVWLNPPYSDVAPWMARLAEHGDGVALVFARTETAWWHDHVWPTAAAVLFLRGRVAFYRRGGVDVVAQGLHNAGGPSALVAYGAANRAALAASGLPGAIVGPARLQ